MLPEPMVGVGGDMIDESSSKEKNEGTVYFCFLSNPLVRKFISLIDIFILYLRYFLYYQELVWPVTEHGEAVPRGE